MLPSLGNTASVTLKVVVTEMFNNCFCQAPWPQLRDWIAHFLNLARDQSSELEIPFSEDEILQSFKDANGYRAPGPDGFSFSFA